MHPFRSVLFPLLAFVLFLPACAPQSKSSEPVSPAPVVVQLPGGVSLSLPKSWAPVNPLPDNLAAAPVVAARVNAKGTRLATVSVRDMAARRTIGQDGLRAMSEAERTVFLDKNTDAARQVFKDRGEVLSVVSRLREMNGYCCIMTTIEFIPDADKADKLSTTAVRAEYMLPERYVSLTVEYGTRSLNTALDNDIEAILALFRPA